MSDEKKELSQVFKEWWENIHDIKNDGKNANRGDLAKLRRLDLIETDEGMAIDLIGARSIASYRYLYKTINNMRGKFDEELGAKTLDRDTEERLIIVAYALARVRENDNAHTQLGALIGGYEDEDRLVKETRFLRFIRSETNADLFDQTRRLCAIIGKTAPIKSLSETLFNWHIQSTRNKLATDYYVMNASIVNE